MSKKSKKKTKLRQNYLPIVVLNNNVKSPKSKKFSNVNKRRKVYNRYSDVESGQFTNDKDTVVYIQNYPPPGGRIDESFERRSGSGSSSSSNLVKAIQPFVSTSDIASYLPVASADSGYGHGGGGGGGYGCCGGGQELSLFEGLIFLAALAAAAYFLNNQIIMFIGKRRKRGEGLFDFFADMIPLGKLIETFVGRTFDYVLNQN